MADNIRQFPVSIQGEHQLALDPDLFADQADVDDFVGKLPDSLLICRERGRHDFPTMREVGSIQLITNADGELIREDVCRTCQCAVRVEVWEGFRRNRQVRYRKVGRSRTYYRAGPNGEKYPAPPGHGRMTPRQIQEAIATQLLAGVSPSTLKKVARKKTAG